MSAGKHTPGPWRTKPDAPFGDLILAGAHVVVARVVGDGRTDTEERRAMVADAALIAAAPDLVEALEWVLPAPAECDRCKRSGGPCVGHAALAKARGE